MADTPDNILRWRLVLGEKADPEQQVALDGQQKGMDEALNALYDADRRGGLGSSSPQVNRWLGDIRRFFPTPQVQVMQRDAIAQLGLKQLLLEKELLEQAEADVHLVATLLSLRAALPAKTRETARTVVRKLVDELMAKLRRPLEEAVRGSLQRQLPKRRPKLRDIDWQRTIRANLQHYQPDYKSIVPEQIWGHGRKGTALKHLILLVDQSGSMASSVVYAGVLGAVLASLRSLRSDVVFFDTAVADMSEHLHDPVELLFAAQLGGGTDIGLALGYAEKLVQQPKDTILFLISDLYEGGQPAAMLQASARLLRSGVQMISLLALNDEGAPAYDRQMAAQYAALGIPVFACTPTLFPSLAAAAIQGEDIGHWMARHEVARR